MKFILFLTAILFISPFALATPVENEFPAPPYPKEAYEKNIQGSVLISVKFGTDGWVSSCDVIKSSGSALLDERTVEFIMHHWKSPEYAGKQFQTPIHYNLPPSQPNLKPTSDGNFDELLCNEGFSRVKLIKGSNQNLVHVEINGHPFTLLVDTGSFTTCISKKAAHASGFETTATSLQNFGMNGAVNGTAELIKINSFKIGEVEMAPSPVLAVDINTNLPSSKFDGLLGLPSLKSNHAVVVVKPGLLYLNPRQPAAIDACLKSSGCYALALRLKNNHYHLPVQLDGYNVQMIFDTGANYSLINERLLREKHFGIKQTYIPSVGIDEHDFTSQEVRIRELYLGGFPFGNLMMHTATPAMFSNKWKADEEANNAGLLGFDVLGSILTIIDTSSDTMYLHQLAK